MKTILEIQKLDRQIRLLNREVNTCQASKDYNNYLKLLKDGREMFEKLEAQANEVINNYDVSANRIGKYVGSADIVKKRNRENISLDNISTLIADSNALVGELSEENRHVEDLVRKSEEIVRKSAELSQKLTEAKKRSAVYKAKIEEKKQEIAPKIAELEKQIKALEPKVEDKAKYEKYKQMKENGIFPVFVQLEGDFCGGCKVELPLNFIEKLKVQHMLPCEHCNRIIMSK